MRSRGLALFAFVLTLTAAGTAPREASAQIPTRIDYWLSATPLSHSSLPPSVRLQGMGHFIVAVDDENSEITLLDYAGSIAGLARDRSKGELELWTQDSPSNAVPSSAKLTEFQTRVVSRRSGRAAIGVRLGRDATKFTAPVWSDADLYWSIANAALSVSTARLWVLPQRALFDSLGATFHPVSHVPLTAEEFRRNFRTLQIGLPPLTAGGAAETLTVTIPNTALIPNVDTVLNAYRGPTDLSLAMKTAAPGGEFFYNRLLGKRTSLGTRLAYHHEGEHGSRQINYLTEYGSTGWTPGLSLAIEPIRGVTLGGLLDYDGTVISGKSDGLNVRASSSHYDTSREIYTSWHRGAHAFVDFGKLGRAAYVWDRSTGDGNQTFHVNWGDQEALFRSGGALQRTGTLFRDSHATTLNKVRVSLHPLSPAVTLGGAYWHNTSMQARHVGDGHYFYANETRWVNVDSLIGELFFGSTKLDRTTKASTLGLSWNIHQKALLAGEYEHEGNEYVSSLRGVATPGTYTRSWLTGGIEMYVTPTITLRAGYEHAKTSETQDRFRRLSSGASVMIAPWWSLDGALGLANIARPANSAQHAGSSQWTRTLSIFSRVTL